MNRFIALLIILSVPCHSLANDKLSYVDGKSLGESLIQGPNALKTEDVPDYQGENVPETDYQENFHKMGDAATEMTHDPENKTGAAVINSQRERLEHGFRITAEDALIKNSNEIISDPLAVIGGEPEKKTGGVREVIETTHVCEESAEPATYTCDQTRHVTLKGGEEKTYEMTISYPTSNTHRLYAMDPSDPTKVYVANHAGGYSWSPFQEVDSSDFSLGEGLGEGFNGKVISISSSNEWFVNTIQNDLYWHGQKNLRNCIMWTTAEYRSTGPSSNGTFVNTRLGAKITIRYKEALSADPKKDVVEDSCSGYEKQSSTGLCVYGSEEILEGPETREFCEGDECLKVTRDWWKRRRTYHCKYPSKDNCGPFRSAGCERTTADCKTRVEGVCVEHQKTFLCRSEKLGNGVTKIGGEVPFCLDGNCDDRSWSPNTDFAEAMSKMSIFREIAKDMDAENATVFRGNGMKCSKSTMSFQDCCGSGGWGRSVGLGQNCSEDEKNLKKERDANKCVRVGTYCSQKEAVTKICLTKKTSFCCFGSKLAKIVHEQGRAQLGIRWGDAKSPDCRPFSVTELQRIDFSKIDLSELYSEIRAKTNIDNVAKAASNLGENWQAKIKAAQKKKKLKASELHNTKENPDVSL
ncbi:MAG TPA: hypothetical protein DD412_07535 [Holosporales bacterium]|nr:hypothetical protein [Holosporales bacterium]